MSAATIESPDVLDKTAPPGDHDKFQHYFSKADITNNLLTGEPMTALCGKVVAKQSDPKGRTVCPTCADLMENLVGSNLPPNERGDADQPL